MKKTILIMLPVPMVYSTAQVNFEQIHGNLYREELGQTTVYDEEWNSIIGINITNTHESMTIISNLKDFLSQNWNKDCLIRSTVQNLIAWCNRLNQKEIVIQIVVLVTEMKKRTGKKAVPMIQSNIEVPRVVTTWSLRF